MGASLLEVNKLEIGFQEKQGYKEIIKGISFDLSEGEILGIVGESGSGKSLTSLAIMDLLAHNAKIAEGSIVFAGRNLLTMTTEEKRAYKGNEISMVFQEPMTSLNPLMHVGEQVEEMLILHHADQSTSYREQVLNMLLEVGLKEPELLYHKYPHELSGGMRQRVMIAMAMICRPKLLIADEPTTALDVTVQAQILELIQKMNETYGTSVIFISHDLGVIQRICNRVLIMYNGEIVEEGQVKDIFESPQEEYTKRLLNAVPRGAAWVAKNQLSGMELDSVENKVKDTLLSVENLEVFYRSRGKHLFQKPSRKHAVRGVSFSIQEGEIFGIVGESGSGKSTVSKAILGLVKEWEGKINLQAKMPQMVFQDPYSSLNPSRTIGWILEEPLKIAGHLSKKERYERVCEMLENVGLTKDYYGRSIRSLSGGQRQRVAIANALMNRCKFIILDEPVSALDVTIQRQILDLLQELRKKYELTYLFISHDLNVVYELCDRIAVMKDGVIVEQGTRDEIYYAPKMEYTRELVKSEK